MEQSAYKKVEQMQSKYTDNIKEKQQQLKKKLEEEMNSLESDSEIKSLQTKIDSMKKE